MPKAKEGESLTQAQLDALTFTFPRPGQGTAEAALRLLNRTIINRQEAKPSNPSR